MARPLYFVDEPARVFSAKNIPIIEPTENGGCRPISRNELWEYGASSVTRLNPIMPINKFVDGFLVGNAASVAKTYPDPEKLSGSLPIVIDADGEKAGFGFFKTQINGENLSNLGVVCVRPEMPASDLLCSSARQIGALYFMSITQLVLTDSDHRFSRETHFTDAAANVTSLRNEGGELKNKNGKSNDANNDQITRVLDQIVIVGGFGSFFNLRLSILFLSFGLLFGGGYNIYRERLILGSSLFGLGSLLGFLSILSGGLPL